MTAVRSPPSVFCISPHPFHANYYIYFCVFSAQSKEKQTWEFRPFFFQPHSFFSCISPFQSTAPGFFWEILLYFCNPSKAFVFNFFFFDLPVKRTQMCPLPKGNLADSRAHSFFAIDWVRKPLWRLPFYTSCPLLFPSLFSSFRLKCLGLRAAK